MARLPAPVRLLLRVIALAALATAAALPLAAAVAEAQPKAAGPLVVPQEGEIFPLGTRVTGPCGGDPDGGTSTEFDYHGLRDYPDLHNDWARRGGPSGGWHVRPWRLSDAAGRLLPECAPLTLRHRGPYTMTIQPDVPDEEEIGSEKYVHFTVDLGLGSGRICGTPAGRTASAALSRTPTPTADTPAGEHCKYRHEPRSSKEFRSCAAFESYFKTKRLALSNVAWAYQYDSKWTYARSRKKESKLQVTITWKLTDEAYVDDPTWSWPNMTKAEKRSVAKARAALSVHEHGHLQVAARYVREHETQTYLADDFDHAAELKEEKVKNWERGMRAERDRYDAVTHNGRTQSQGPSKGYPDGEDVEFSCS